MPITSVTQDTDAVTVTIVAEFPVTVRRLWDAYADPRQIEQFWGPHQWPATFSRHDMYPGGRSHYVMHGPEGEISAGFWEFASVDPPRSFEVRDGFADEDGTPNTEMPAMRMVYTFEPIADGVRLTTTTWFHSAEELEQLLEMGMEEGAVSAMSQIDEVVADSYSYAPGRHARARTLSDTQIRISRVVHGPVEQVWAAHHDPELIRRWMLGPDGWTMPVCEAAGAVGESYRYEWEPVPGSRAAKHAQRFGFVGEVLEQEAPHREVTTEQLIGAEGPGTMNELTLTPVEEGTLVATVITYPDAQTRDQVLKTGMVDGMEASYQRMEQEVLTG